MKLTESQIKTKKMAGHTQDGAPVVYIETLGGLHLFFTKKDKQMISLAAAPHRAIAQWMAEKKEQIKWDKGFFTKTETLDDTLKKNEEALYGKLRSVLWGKQLSSIESNKGQFLVYNCQKKEFAFLTKKELSELLQQQPSRKYDPIRELSLDRLATMACLHEDFKDLV